MPITITPGYVWKEGEYHTARKENLAASPTASISPGGVIGPTEGGTGISSYVLGDTLYASAVDTLAKLSGNITATRKFLRQLGTGAVSAAPVWDTVTKTDVGLSNVENTALSTWAGSTNLTILGIIVTGVWNGTAITNAYLANSSLTINGTSISLGASGTVTAAAGTLTGTTLNATVVNSSLTSVGTLAGLVTATAIKTGTYTVTATDHFIVGNHATVAFTITMIAASSNTGREFIFKNKGAAIVTIDATGLGTIDGANTLTLRTNASAYLKSDGAQWNRINLQGA